MPERAAVITLLIMERPLCLSCISSRSGLTAREVKSHLRKIKGTVDVLGRCRACETATTVYSIRRK